MLTLGGASRSQLLESEMSAFDGVKLAPPIEVFHLMRQYNEDPYEDKVNLSIGAYRTNEGKPWVLPVVRTAEKALTNDEKLNKEYLPVLGLESLSIAATCMLLGEDSTALLEKRAFGVQSLSGTGTLRLGAEFLARVLGRTVCYFSNPTWGNHKLVFMNAGFTDAREYRYWSQKKRGLDFDGFLEDLRNAPEKAVVLLHVCAHNPTGCDPTIDQWAEIVLVMREKNLFPFFDSAYQGYASGDLHQDAKSVRFFVAQGFELFCAQSFAKNFGLYDERIGNLAVVLNKPEMVPPVKSQFAILVRGMYSNPPSHGARIITYILTNEDLYSLWKENVKIMASRIIEMRRLLRKSLERLGTPGDWSHITSQIGMFSYPGLNEPQSINMVKKYHIYMLKSGRISMCGITPSNVDYVAQAIKETLKTIPI